MAKTPPHRPVYDFENTATQTGRSKDKKRPIYDYDHTALHKSDAPRAPETVLPVEKQQPVQQAQPQRVAQTPVFDQDEAPPRRKPSQRTGMQQMVLPLGTVQVPQQPENKERPTPAKQQQTAKPPAKPAPAAKKPPQQKPNRPQQAAQKPAPQTKPVQKKPPAQQRPPEKSVSGRPAAPAAKPVPKRPLTYGEARRRRRNRNIMAASAVVLVIFFGTLLSFTVLFKIETITVNGETRYTADEILTVSNLQKGDNLLRLNPEKTAQDLCVNLPYLQTVTIKKRMPATVEIVTQPAVETYTLNTASGWAVLGADFKVLRLDAEPTAGLTILFGTTADTPVPGTQIIFTEPEKQEALAKVTKAIADEELSDVTEIDVTNTLELSFLYAGRIRVLLGTVNDLASKVDYAKYIITPEGADSLPDTARGTLDVSSRTAEGRLQGFWRAGNL